MPHKELRLIMGEWIAVVPRLPSWPPSLDHCSGFDASTRTFHSLRPPVPLPPMSRPFSFASFIASLLPSPFPAKPTVAALTFPDLFSQVRSLAAALCSEAGLAKGHVALVLAPTSLDIPPLYLALLSLGAVVSPANPASTPSELPRLVELSRPRLAFAISATAAKLPRHITTILLDSPRFRSFLSGGGGDTGAGGGPAVQRGRHTVLVGDDGNGEGGSAAAPQLHSDGRRLPRMPTTTSRGRGGEPPGCAAVPLYGLLLRAKWSSAGGYDGGDGRRRRRDGDTASGGAVPGDSTVCVAAGGGSDGEVGGADRPGGAGAGHLRRRDASRGDRRAVHCQVSRRKAVSGMATTELSFLVIVQYASRYHMLLFFRHVKYRTVAIPAIRSLSILMMHIKRMDLPKLAAYQG
ncbi:hypothetical protein BHE74_00029824 [Ensete ventricosum]|nr:hypothetical protein BHE74_00029824 [Ensete ventricosum]